VATTAKDSKRSRLVLTVDISQEDIQFGYCDAEVLLPGHAAEVREQREGGLQIA
jgi:hypothetical protein